MGKISKIALWKQILIAIVIGGLVGTFVPQAVPVLKPFGTIFLRLLKMLIAPLVLFTLTSGVCKMGDIKQLRTVGIRIVAFYVVTSTFSAALGMSFALFTQPGKGVTDLLTTGKVGKTVSYSFVDNAIQWIPTNIFESLSTGNTLQIIVFALFAGVVLLALGDEFKPFVDMIDKAAGVMLKMTDMVMKYSPIGILALVAEMVTTLSGKMMAQVANFILTDWAACLIIIFICNIILT